MHPFKISDTPAIAPCFANNESTTARVHVSIPPWNSTGVRLTLDIAVFVFEEYDPIIRRQLPEETEDGGCLPLQNHGRCY